MRYLEVRGDAHLETDEGYAFADRVGAKYGGADLRQMDGDDQRRGRGDHHAHPDRPDRPQRLIAMFRTAHPIVGAARPA